MSAVVMLAASIGIMIKSSELNIGWIPGRGPGAGAWPFWLAGGMALSCVWTMVRWFLGVTAESRNLDQYIPRETVFIVFITLGSLVFLLLATSFIGMYFALMLFLLFYIVFVGRHSWFMGLSFMVGVPVFVFCLFEWALTTSLPKGIGALEPLYYPLYDIIYSPSGWQIGAAILVWIYGAIAIGALADREGRNSVLTLLIGFVATPIAGGIYHFAMAPKPSGGADGA